MPTIAASGGVVSSRPSQPAVSVPISCATIVSAGGSAIARFITIGVRK